MSGNVSWLFLLMIFSGLSMNLILQFCIGLQEIAAGESFPEKDKYNRTEILIRQGILFAVVLLLWLVFSLIRKIFSLGLLEYILIFPAGYAACSFLEYLVCRFIFKRENAISGNGLVSTVLVCASLFITLNMAGNLPDAIVLSLGFAAGVLLTAAIVNEIRKRAQMETVPRFLQGWPLSLIAMGLLSLVFSSASLMFFEVLGAK